LSEEKANPARMGVHKHVDGLIRLAPLPLTPVSTRANEAKIAAWS